MRQTFLAIGIGVALVVAFFWGNLVTPAVNYTPTVGTNDLTDLNYPFRSFLSESLKRGELPLWSSAISSGYPILAEGQIGALYPLNIAFAWFPTLTSINLTIVSMYLILFLFSFLYLRKIRLGIFSSIFGAMLVTFSGFGANELMHFGMNISYGLFVGQLWLLEHYLQRRGSIVPILLMGSLLGLSVLGGHPQIIFYSLFFLIAYWLVFWFVRREGTTKKRMSFLTLLAGIVLFGVVGLGIGAGQFLPQLEFTLNSTRASGLQSEAISRFQFPVSDLVTFLLPFSKYLTGNSYSALVSNGWPRDEQYVYMGVVGLGLALSSLFQLRKSGPNAVFFAAAAGAALLLSFGTQFTTGFIFQLPPFSFFRLPFRILFLTNFSLAILAAMVMDRLSLRVSKRGFKNILQILFLGAVFCISFLDLNINAKKLYPEVDARQWYAQPQVTAFLSQRLRNQERVVSQQYFYATAKIFLEQYQIWNNPNIFINLRNLLPVFNNLLYQIPMNVGAANSGGLKIDRYNELESEIFFRGMEFTDAETVKISDSFMFINRIMGVRFLLTTSPIEHFLLQKAYEIPFETGQDSVYVYEFFDYFPRIMMVPRAEKATPKGIVEHLMKVDFDPKQVVYVEEDADWGAEGGYAATADFDRYTDQEIEISTQASGNGFLFLSDTYYPGWKAYVDGQETRILLADYAFRAVPVPEGKHSVVFRYEPRSFWWGVRITLITVGLTLVAIVGILLVKSKKQQRTRGNRS